MVATIAASASIAAAQDTAKYQPAILDLRACIRANAPPALIAGVRGIDEAFQYFRAPCYQPFDVKLTQLGAADASAGGFRLIVREEWDAFLIHTGR